MDSDQHDDQTASWNNDQGLAINDGVRLCSWVLNKCVELPGVLDEDWLAPGYTRNERTAGSLAAAADKLGKLLD